MMVPRRSTVQQLRICRLQRERPRPLPPFAATHPKRSGFESPRRLLPFPVPPLFCFSRNARTHEIKKTHARLLFPPKSAVRGQLGNPSRRPPPTPPPAATPPEQAARSPCGPQERAAAGPLSPSSDGFGRPRPLVPSEAARQRGLRSTAAEPEGPRIRHGASRIQ